MKALIADDEPPARARMASLLAEAGGVDVVAEVGDGRSAVELASRLAPDLILLDWMLPGMSGLDLIWSSRSASNACRPR